MCEVTLAVQKLSTTLNSQQNSFISSFACIKSCSSLYSQPPIIKLVLFIGPKLIASIFFSFARSKANSKASNTVFPDSADTSLNL